MPSLKIELPTFGLAPIVSDSNETIKVVYEKFITKGVKHFVITELFGNGHLIATALRESGLQRSDYFVTLKLWPKGRDRSSLILACQSLLRTCKLEYADLVMLHAPIEFDSRIEHWRALEEMVSANLTKYIGIVNSSIAQLTELLKICNVRPSVFELEVTPFNQSSDITEFCVENGISILCSNPLAKNLQKNNRVIADISAQLSISQEALMLRWVRTKEFALLLDDKFDWDDNTLDTLDQSIPRTSFDRLNAQLGAEDAECTAAFISSWLPKAEDDDD